MSKKSNYHSTNRSRHYLKVHLIFVCKYRKKLLIGQLKDKTFYSFFKMTFILILKINYCMENFLNIK